MDFDNRSQLRKVLGLAVGNADQAHHILPCVWRNHDVIQNAAKSGNAFHMSEALNGIAVAAWRNQPNHNTYNSLIKNKLDALPTNLNPNEAYTALVNILNQAKQAIINNPNTHLNDLIF
ncbi:AHH domain-containing protein [Flavobacterium sp. HNIBRBA15423]|uniref:AHH domain-containing protein n=1 Tax=Flavobacterium sp. HNIBRBA15423 TaxID=3458683 RepID=UPI0040447759